VFFLARVCVCVFVCVCVCVSARVRVSVCVCGREILVDSSKFLHLEIVKLYLMADSSS
jgi:hypothetical protein